MATLTVNPIPHSASGVDVTVGGSNFSAASGGGDDFVLPAGGIAYLIIDSGATTSNVTIAGVRTCEQGVVHNLVVAMGANETRMVKLDGRYKNSSGKVAITYSATTDISVCPLSP